MQKQYQFTYSAHSSSTKTSIVFVVNGCLLNPGFWGIWKKRNATTQIIVWFLRKKQNLIRGRDGEEKVCTNLIWCPLWRHWSIFFISLYSGPKSVPRPQITFQWFWLMSPSSSIVCIFINGNWGVAINPTEGCKHGNQNQSKFKQNKKKRGIWQGCYALLY